MSTTRKNKDLGQKLFSFAVVADSHLNQDEAQCNSPFAVNKLANGRMRYVVRDINTRNVDFVIHLGDLIHPVPAVKKLYLEAADRFQKQVDELKVPLYLTPGNHDIGDKPMPWAPVGVVTDEYVSLWQDTFGDHYYSFDHKGIHFVVINSQLMNTGLAVEQEQKRWIERDLRENKDKRIFLSTHYPPFLCETGEAEHYDNIAEPERSWLLDIMAKCGVESLFGGHVHNFWYLKHQGTHHYLLPSTAFVRQDYSEMFKAPPTFEEYEAGRNDAPKLGYFVTHVYEKGHVCQMVRTYGECTEPDAPEQERVERIEPVSPVENRHAPLGFDLRQCWADKLGIPPSGGLDEFDRKEVRNDYPLLALWEMGVKKLRVPMQDLRNEDTRQRIYDLQQLGHTFTLFSFNLPSKDDELLVVENSRLFEGWEIGFRWEKLDKMGSGLAELRRKTDVPIYLSRMWGHDDSVSPDGQYYHVMNHGFTIADASKIGELTSHDNLQGVGVVFRAMKNDDVSEVISFSGKVSRDYDIPASVHLRMAGYNPAEPTCDDSWVSSRIAEALMSAASQENINVFVDTLTDIDRGYFVRNGVLDQTCNPRQGARIVCNLYAALNASSEVLSGCSKMEAENGVWVYGKKGLSSMALFIANSSIDSSNVALPDKLFQQGCNWEVIDLDSGVIQQKEGVELAIESGSLLLLRE